MLFAVALFFSSCNQSPKIAYVDMDQILKEYKAFTKAEETMKVKSAKISANLQQRQMEFQQKVQDYQQRRTKISKSEASKLEQQLIQEQSMLQQQQQMIQKQYQEEGNKLYDQIDKDIDDFVTGYAKKNGYDLILGKSKKFRSVLYATEKLDITQDLIDGLNKSIADNNIQKTDSTDVKDTVK